MSLVDRADLTIVDPKISDKVLSCAGANWKLTWGKYYRAERNYGILRYKSLDIILEIKADCLYIVTIKLKMLGEKPQ